jgi:hypothetical protein
VTRAGFQRGVFVLALVLATALHAEPLRRFALMIGNDAGGAGTQPLRYAREDARKMHELMARLGGVQPSDALLLLNQDARAVLTGLTELEGRIQAAQARGERTALLVFYSGHAKDEALRLGDTRLPFATLKQRLAEAPADIRIAILDSCRAGTLTRAKGARRAPAFSIDAGTSRDARGLVILTSSTADEDSQESDALGGSYFSHHLFSGLQGDADRSGDGRVTLFEAYSHAYARTVADTAASGAGAQHPTFSYELAGNGDLVLTELRASEGLLVPRDAPEGLYYFVDASGLVAAELNKAREVERRVALAPGTYRVKRRLEDRLRTGDVTVRSGQETVLEESRLRDTPFSDDPVKGARPPGAFWVLGVTGGMQSFLDRSVRDTLFLPSPLLGVEARLHDYLRQDWVWGFDVAVGGRDSRLALPTLTGVDYRYSVLCLGTSLTAEWPVGAWRPFAGARLTYVVLRRSFQEADYPDQQYAAFSPGLVGGVRYRWLRKLHVAGQARLHTLLYNVERPQRTLGYWELSGLVAYEL